MPWIFFFEPFTECAHSVRIRTITALDPDCVLKATVQVCTACMVVSLLTTCMNFNKNQKSKKSEKKQWKKKRGLQRVPPETAQNMIVLRNVKRNRAAIKVKMKNSKNKNRNPGPLRSHSALHLLSRPQLCYVMFAAHCNKMVWRSCGVFSKSY